MAYTNNDGVDITIPDGSVAGTAAQIDTFLKDIKKAYNERLADAFGGDWALTTNLILTKLGPYINISTKLPYCPEYDAGNSGATKTLDLAANGPAQKLTLTANCTITVATPAAGANGYIRTVQDGTGGRTLTWPSNVEFEGETAPTINTTASKCTVYTWISDGTKLYVFVPGTNFSVS